MPNPFSLFDTLDLMQNHTEFGLETHFFLIDKSFN